MAKTLLMDFETRSAIDIGKCGSFRYINDPSFRVLLLAYAFDDEPVKLVDFEKGGAWPGEVLDALDDPTVTLLAWNCSFEREVIRHELGYSAPERWLDVMHVAAQCGLPMSLDSAGKALNLDEGQAKMKEGKALIRFFCCPRKPTKTNPKDWNDPEDAPDKWQTFRDYCVRDVEAERTIYNLLKRWTPNEEERRLWCLDARINERGVRIDRRLAEMAVAMDARYKEELTAQAVALTGMDNPKSVAQIKTWLFDQEGKEFPSLNKRVIAEVVSQLQTAEAHQFMGLRSELSKSSTAKYAAMLRGMDADDHARGCFQFYGTSTGRFCLTGDHEVLTPTGWVRLDAWQGGSICVWSMQNEMLSFQPSEAVSFPFDGTLIRIDSARCQQASTGEHRMPTRRSNGEIRVRTMDDLFDSGGFSFPLRAERERRAPKAGNDIRVLIMVQADGHYTADGSLKLGFTRKRKIERCRRLLRLAGIPYVETKQDNGRKTQFTIRHRDQPLWLRAFRDKTFGWWLLDEDATVVVEELEHWDGSRCGPNSIQYTTTNKQNADVIQALLHTSGYVTTMLVKRRGEEHPNWNDAYILNIWLTPGKDTKVVRRNMSLVPYVGRVYCATTPTGFFLVRRNGVVWISGNSGRRIQFQNMSKNRDPTLDEMRTLVRNGHYTALKAIYGSVADCLSQLVRTAIIPEDGHRILVADYSAVEARVIAWIAGEQWALDAFRQGKDIYCETASRMFHVPVEKHGANAELRQKGKVASLGLGFGGGVGALKAFGADKMGMSDEEMQETVDLWRESNPHIVKLWKALWASAVRSISEKTSVISAVGKIRFDYENGVLWMTLPSGRRIAYWGARVEDSARFGGMKSITVMSVNQVSRKWERTEIWRGTLAENLTQATARDILREALFNLTEQGFDVRATVHDEVICTEPIGGKTVQQLCEAMCPDISWARGLPLKAEGYEGAYYYKD